MNKRLNRDDREQLRDLGWRRLFRRKAKRPDEMPEDALLVFNEGDDGDLSIEAVDLEDRR